jgi:hypothetical protein
MKSLWAMRAGYCIAMTRGLRARATAVIVSSAILLALGSATPAVAFDTGPHAELVDGALSALGFERDAVGVAEVNDWLSDLYGQAALHPFSGHGGFFKRLLAGVVASEQWPDSVTDAAFRNHFSKGNFPNTATVTAEWDRLRRAVYAMVQEARDHDDPEALLAIIGMSLHPVGDFYTHSNWVEPRSGHGLPGVDGPGWQERGFGSNPTWFDIPPSDREAVRIYTDSSTGHRIHGYWNSDGNLSMRTGMNKDSPGRPYYLRAVTTAYFAERQWVEAIRSWVNDEGFWAKAQHYRADQRQLDHDLEGMYRIQVSVGHWEGEGEPFGGTASGPGGSLLAARSAIRDYFQKSYLGTLHGRTIYRARYERLIKQLSDPQPTGRLVPIPSSQSVQRATRFVVLRVTNMHSKGFFGLGDPGADPADMYANVRIDGQSMTSAIINDRDSFSFPKPFGPFTFVKAVPAIPDEEEPVESVEVVVRTANVRWAGTDDDVYLRLAGGLRLPLDKGGIYNDFEQGDTDRYSVPIDGAIRRGLTVGDITRVALEKSPDKIAGGWKVGGMELFVNGREIYDNQHIDRWLEDNHRVWTAPDFLPSNPRGPKVPVVVNMRESDSYYGADDEGDINPYDNRDIVSIGYAPGLPIHGTTSGGNKLGGRLDFGANEAGIAYGLSTIVPETVQGDGAPPQPEPEEEPPPYGKPDLAITQFTTLGITVENRGDAPAGHFRVRIGLGLQPIYLSFSGLDPGASETRPLALDCFATYFAVVDDLEQVVETDEENNTAETEPIIC